MRLVPWLDCNMEQISEFDIIVIGSGASGLSAALRAQHLGARVLVIEKAQIIGGTTAMSGGCIWVPNHHHQKNLGVEDTAEDALAYIRAISPVGWHNSEEALWRAFVDQSPKMLKFIEETTPIIFKPNLAMKPKTAIL